MSPTTNPLNQGGGTAAVAAQLPLRGPEVVPFTFLLNGTPREVAVEPRVSLLDLLREQLDLTGTKKGCDHGTCGALLEALRGGHPPRHSMDCGSFRGQ